MGKLRLISGDRIGVAIPFRVIITTRLASVVWLLTPGPHFCLVPMLRLAFLGIDHPHGAHWRQQLANFSSEAEIVAFVPSFSAGSASLEERFADLPRFDSISGLLGGAQFDAAVVCLNNQD